MELRFLREPRNVLILGPTGVGKTFLATAIGNHACRVGFSCLFVGVNVLVERLTLARADGTFLKYRDRLVKTDVLILDDLGIRTLPPETIQDLYDILEERYQTRSTIITSQLPLANWKEVIDDAVALETILDRLIHGAVKIELSGESYRKKRAKVDRQHDPWKSATERRRLRRLRGITFGKSGGSITGNLALQSARYVPDLHRAFLPAPPEIIPFLGEPR